MLPSGHSSSSSLNFSPPPTLFTEAQIRQRRTTMTPSRPPRPGSPRRRAVTDINDARILLGQRSRSDSKLCTVSSWEQLPSPSSDLSTRPSSRGTRSSGASFQEGRPDSIAMFMTKGTKLLAKRKKIRLDLRPLRTAEWMIDTDDVTNSKHVQELSKRRKSKHSRATSAGYEYLLKKSISDPYNFQHLTHTGAHQGKALQCADQNELVSEFSAIRASQAPRAALKGIKAETLHRPNRSIGTGSPLPSYDSPPVTSTSPTKSRDDLGGASSGGIRYSRSVDSFTRVAARSFCSPTPPLSPPGRRSSRMAMRLPPVHLSSADRSPTASNFGVNPDEDPQCYYHNTSPRYVSPSISEDVGFQFDISGIAQAVTTPDDSAYILGSNLRPSPSAALADVPEEDEAFPWGRNLNSILQAPTEMATIRHSKSFPSADLSRNSSVRSVNRTKQYFHPVLSEEWGTASDPTLPGTSGQNEDIPVYSRRLSTHSKALGDSWEDDIDFCYEHAAEADSAFDWYNVPQHAYKEIASTADETTFDRSSSVYEEQIASPTAKSYSIDMDRVPASRPSSHLSNYLNLSRLTTSTIGSTTDSAASSAVTVPGIVTPAEPTYPSHSISVATTSHGTAIGPLSPSCLVPQDWASQATHEDAIHYKLTDSDASMHSFAAYGPLSECDASRDFSPRNSGSALSKCNSRDSTFPSRTASINTGHGTSSSVSSLPELVYSEAGGERVARAAESLADHIASLNVAENPAGLKLMIEVARQNFIRRAEDSADEREQRAPVQLPLMYPRQRSSSESANRLLDGFGAGPVRPKLATVNSVDRMRSTNVTNQLAGRSRLTRASYSLFPVHNVDT